MECKKCKRDKLTEVDFYRSNNLKSGLGYYCKKCHNQYAKNYEKNHPEAREKRRVRRKVWRAKNRIRENEKQKKYSKTYMLKNQTDYAKRIIKNRLLAKDGLRICSKCNTLKEIVEYYKGFSMCIKCLRNGVTPRKKMDPLMRKLSGCVSSHVYISLKGNKGGASWEKLVGYTLKDLKKHLEKLFQKGMSWKNHGEWHIDHKIPVSVFNFKTPNDPDFKRCWDLSNLQPLWAVDNLKKNAKIDVPFQPSLILDNNPESK